MRVLVTSTSGLGHVNPLMPLAQAFVRRGDDVLWATASDAHGTIEAAGVRVAAAGMSGSARLAEYRQRYPEWQHLQPQEVPAHLFPRAFGEIGVPPMLDDLLPIAKEWKPDLVVHEVGEFAAPIVAGSIGVPHVTQGFGARLRPERLPDVNERVAPYWRKAGLEPRPRAGAYDHLYLDIYPPCLDPGYDDDVGSHQLLRPITNDESAERDATDWLERDEGRPFVYVTFGTVFNAPTPVFRAAVAEVAKLDARALVTVGPGADTEAFGALPHTIRVAEYVPQHQVLARASLVVSHAGSGTFLAALARGIPQLCLPQAADQFANATACEHAGAGVQIPPQTATPDTMGPALRALMDDAGFATAAGRVGDDIAAMPDPDDVAAIVASRFAPN